MRNIEGGLQDWLENLSKSWELTIQDVATAIAADEIRNRILTYPTLRKSLLDPQFDLNLIADKVHSCWVMGGRYDSVRFNSFVNNKEESASILQKLITEFPGSENEASERIDNFIQDAVGIGFSKPDGGSDLAGAAQFASLILTCLMPNRFVDYRQSRWEKFAIALDYPVPTKGSSHGEWIVWSGKFAISISETSTYKKYWPVLDNGLSVPNWVLSGICWVGLEPKKPIFDPISPEISSFPEGSAKRRLHLTRERNRTLIAQIKAQAKEEDQYLKCQICGFSFLKSYGEIGNGFIEAHHKIPVSKLTKGSRTKIQEIALICSNCHSMIHHGERSLTIDELKNMLN